MQQTHGADRSYAFSHLDVGALPRPFNNTQLRQPADRIYPPCGPELEPRIGSRHRVNQLSSRRVSRARKLVELAPKGYELLTGQLLQRMDESR